MNVKFNKRLKILKFSKHLLIVALWIISTFITAYTIKAYLVSIHICYFDGDYYWRSTGPGTFFPWPREPGMLTALSEMSYNRQALLPILHKNIATCPHNRFNMDNHI